MTTPSITASVADRSKAERVYDDLRRRIGELTPLLGARLNPAGSEIR
jgi:hypothetical protein